QAQLAQLAREGVRSAVVAGALVRGAVLGVVVRRVLVGRVPVRGVPVRWVSVRGGTDGCGDESGPASDPETNPRHPATGFAAMDTSVPNGVGGDPDGDLAAARQRPGTDDHSQQCPAVRGQSTLGAVGSDLQVE